MQHPAWLLIIFGVMIAICGGLWLVAPQLPWLGRLPGDVRIEGERTRVYLPITTCLLISLVLTLLLRFVSKFR